MALCAHVIDGYKVWLAAGINVLIRDLPLVQSEVLAFNLRRCSGFGFGSM